MSPPRAAHAAAAISVDPAELERAAVALTRVAAGLSEAREALVRSWLFGAAGLNGTATAAPEMISVGSTPASGRMMLLPALGVLALLMLVAGPLLLWFSSTGRGPQWLRR